jgi:hypothetical protein
MPGVMGGIVSAIVIVVVGRDGYPAGYLPLEDAENNSVKD